MLQLSLRTKLISSFSIVIVAGVFLSAFIGIRLIGDTILKQAQDKVRLDLNAAREVYEGEREFIKNVVRLTAARFFMKEVNPEVPGDVLCMELQKIRENENLDILTLINCQGEVIFRARKSSNAGYWNNDEIVEYVTSKKQTIVSTRIISEEELEEEGNDMKEQARITILQTPKAKPSTTQEETSGMIIEAAAPVTGYDDKLIGILIGGKLLNRNYEIVDKVKDMVYKDEHYKEKDIGTVTIFQGDLRISTNVKNKDGTRAIGTRVSTEVFDQVLVKGIPWIERAFVVTDWYFTAYEPIRNLHGEIIGMLYVGMLETPYIDLRNRVVFIFLSIALMSILLLSVIAYFTSTNITKPVKELVIATGKISDGDLSHKIKIKSHDEIGFLANSFNIMTGELQKVTEGYRNLTKTLEGKVKKKTEELEEAQNQIIQSEKLTALGKLAAGIAHEINNPLTSILINSCLIEEKIGVDTHFKDNIQLIIDETTRCSEIVRELLHFSRQTPPEKKPADINSLIEKTLKLFESQFLVNHIKVIKNFDDRLPILMIDINKIEQVFTNLILNAIEAMQEGGALLISSHLSDDIRYIEIKFRDEGCGILKENIVKIFDPFFSTKGMKGTGLGLSVSYGIIEQHNGTIDVESTVDKGSTFTIKLPVNVETQ